jgi:ribonuclease P protein component
LTLPEPSAYRWPVTWCRPVPHVHGGSVRLRGWAVPAERGALLIPPVRTAPNTTERDAREQAYVPAEQPTSPQGARFPPAHAHPRRPLHPLLAPTQGPQEPRRLTARLFAPGLAVLPAAHRLTEGDRFRDVVRRGRRAGSATVVVHRGDDPGGRRPRVGFVVSRAVGSAVVRNRVQRRLRHLVADHLEALPGSAVLVVRALPASAAATSATLAADLDQCLRRVTA